MTHTYWVSTAKWTGRVVVNEAGIIATASPILASFVGQPMQNLRLWGRRLGGYQEENITKEETEV